MDFFNEDCIKVMSEMPDNSVDLFLTDVPYGEINRPSNGIRKFDKGAADIVTFDVDKFITEANRITSGTIIVFCGISQLAKFSEYFRNEQESKRGTMRQLVWTKTNPSPVNGDYIYLSAIENAIWFRKRGGVFNAHCKKNVFSYPCGRSKVHPTEKNHDLIKELILDNSNEGQLVFDACAGSGTHLMVAKQLGRNVAGCELNPEWFEIAKERIESVNKGE